MKDPQYFLGGEGKSTQGKPLAGPWPDPDSPLIVKKLLYKHGKNFFYSRAFQAYSKELQGQIQKVWERFGKKITIKQK